MKLIPIGAYRERFELCRKEDERGNTVFAIRQFLSENVKVFTLFVFKNIWRYPNN